MSLIISKVIVNYYKHKKEAKEIAKVIRKSGGEAILVLRELSIRSVVLNFFKLIRKEYN